MATQGTIAVYEKGEIVFSAHATINGYFAPKMAYIIKTEGVPTSEELARNMALRADWGCDDPFCSERVSFHWGHEAAMNDYWPADVMIMLDGDA